MTRKDYTLIAAAIAKARTQYGYGAGTAADGIGTAMMQIAFALQEQNPGFRMSSFVKAAGGEPEPVPENPHDHYRFDDDGKVSVLTDELDEGMQAASLYPDTDGRYNLGDKDDAQRWVVRGMVHAGLDPSATYEETGDYAILILPNGHFKLEAKTEVMKRGLWLQFTPEQATSDYISSCRTWVQRAVNLMETPEKWENEHYSIRVDEQGYTCLYPKTDAVRQAVEALGHYCVEDRFRWTGRSTAARVGEQAVERMARGELATETEHYRLEQRGDHWWIIALSDEFERAMQERAWWAASPREYDFGRERYNVEDCLHETLKHMRELADA